MHNRIDGKDSGCIDRDRSENDIDTQLATLQQQLDYQRAFDVVGWLTLTLLVKINYRHDDVVIVIVEATCKCDSRLFHLKIDTSNHSPRNIDMCGHKNTAPRCTLTARRDEELRLSAFD